MSAPDLQSLAPFDDEGRLRAVVETPRGSTCKIKWEPSIRAFVFGRPLPLGFAYPYDWGFIPGTKASDGDPLDVLVVHERATYPGVVIPSRIVGLVRLTQKSKRGGRERNDRVVAVPVDEARSRGLTSLPARVRAEIAHFFLSSVAFQDKAARISGWDGPRAARALIAKSRA